MEAFEILIRIDASNKTYVVDFVDVRKAYFNCKSNRRVVIKLPFEAGGSFAVLTITFYGTCDAANAWAGCITEVMVKLGFGPGTSTPGAFYHRRRDLRAAVHGDDFVAVGSCVQVRWL